MRYNIVHRTGYVYGRICTETEIQKLVYKTAFEICYYYFYFFISRIAHLKRACVMRPEKTILFIPGGDNGVKCLRRKIVYNVHVLYNRK